MKFMTIFSFLSLFLSVPLLGMDAPFRITPVNYSKSTETTDSALHEGLEPLFPIFNLDPVEPTVEDIPALSQQTIQARAASDTATESLDTQTATSKFKCTECPTIYNSMYDLKHHLLAAHTVYKPYKCPKCVFAAVQKSNLGKHIKSCHPDFPIGDIPKLTDHEKKLMEQILAPFLAKLSYLSCNQSYDNKIELDLHEQHTHKQQRQHEAFTGEIHGELYVGLPFAQAIEPVVPAKTETKKPVEWKFDTEEKVKKEEKRSYVCSAAGCSSSFCIKEDLKSHILFNHTSLRPHNCPNCSFNAARKTSLIAHMQRCAPGLSAPVLNDEIKKQIKQALAPFLAKLNFQCPNCTASFTTQRRLTLHNNKEMKRRATEASSDAIDPLSKRTKQNPQDE